MSSVGRDRAIMVDLCRQRGIKSEAVLSAMLTVPREKFVSENLLEKSHGDHPLPIPEGQTISQPLMVAMMTEALELSNDSNFSVLEVGTGCGYQACIISEICRNGRVFTIERIGALLTEASSRIRSLGYDNVQCKHADGHKGWKENSPFDRIIVTAGAQVVPPDLIEQLKVGGIMIIPAHTERSRNLCDDFAETQELLKITKESAARVSIKSLGGCRFVPLVKDP